METDAVCGKEATGARAAPGLWTPAALKRLTHLWTETALSSAGLAKDMTESQGVPFSRNAVIGKVHRLGLTQADRAAVIAERARQAAEPKAESIPAAPVIEAAPKAPLAVEALPFQPPEPRPNPKPAPAVRSDPVTGFPGYLLTDPDFPLFGCRFPVWSRGSLHRMCGGPTTVSPSNPHRSWCEEHLDVVFDRRAPATRRAEFLAAQKAKRAA